MRAILAVLLYCLLFALPAAAAENADGVAVIIGNANYDNRDIPSVDYAHRDADAFRRYVVDVLGFAPENLIDLREATKGQMEAAFGNAQSHRGKAYQYVKPGKSDVVVFYSGHGVPGLRDKRGYLLPVDADPAAAEINGFPIEVLYENLAKLEARSVTVYLDACFSGNSPKGMLVKSASPIFVKSKTAQAPEGVTVLTAASGDQLASWDRESGHGLFTNHLLDALYGKADKNGNGAITLSEVSAYLANTMTLAARRTFNRDQTATAMGPADAVLARLPEGRQVARPDLGRPGSIGGPAQQGTAGALSVRMWTESKTYREGQQIIIHLEGNKDFYGLVVYRDAAGNLIQLLPNRIRTDNKFEGGKVYTIPDRQDAFALQVQPPFGAEKILVFASTRQLGQVNGTAIGGGLLKLRGTLDDVRQVMRSIAVVGTGAEGGKGEFFETDWDLLTRK